MGRGTQSDAAGPAAAARFVLLTSAAEPGLLRRGRIRLLYLDFCATWPIPEFNVLAPRWIGRKVAALHNYRCGQAAGFHDSSEALRCVAYSAATEQERYDGNQPQAAFHVGYPGFLRLQLTSVWISSSP